MSAGPSTAPLNKEDVFLVNAVLLNTLHTPGLDPRLIEFVRAVSQLELSIDTVDDADAITAEVQMCFCRAIERQRQRRMVAAKAAAKDRRVGSLRLVTGGRG